MRTIVGIQHLDPEEFPREYYPLTIVARASGISATHLRKCRLRKYRFGNTDYIKVKDFNAYLDTGDA